MYGLRGVRLGVLVLLLAGCAADQDARRSVAQADSPRVEIEPDGLPAQTPPRRRSLEEPDDPSEPFSPNYGGAPLRKAQRPAAASAQTL